VLYEQCTRLARKGHRVHILTRMTENRTTEHEVIHGVHEWRYRINEKSPLSYLFSTVRNGGRLFESLHGQHHYKCLNFHQPFSAYAVIRSPMARGIKKVYTCHSLSIEEYISRNPASHKIMDMVFNKLNLFVRKHIEKIALNASDRIVVLSDYTKEKLRTIYKIDPGKIEIISGGVDLERFSPEEDKLEIRKKLNIPQDRLIIFTVRNLVNRMGLENLLLALDSVRKEFPNIYTVIGGDGPLKTSLKNMTKKLALDEFILFTGFIPEELLPDYYRMADVFVLPTRELEGFGLVTLEAMASGLPVLGTPAGGTLEILGSFNNDFLFDDMSSEAIADKLKLKCRMILENSLQWTDISRQCRQFVEKKYNWDKNVAALEKLMIT